MYNHQIKKYLLNKKILGKLIYEGVTKSIYEHKNKEYIIKIYKSNKKFSICDIDPEILSTNKDSVHRESNKKYLQKIKNIDTEIFKYFTVFEVQKMVENISLIELEKMHYDFLARNNCLNLTPKTKFFDGYSIAKKARVLNANSSDRTKLDNDPIKKLLADNFYRNFGIINQKIVILDIERLRRDNVMEHYNI